MLIWASSRFHCEDSGCNITEFLKTRKFLRMWERLRYGICEVAMQKMLEQRQGTSDANWWEAEMHTVAGIAGLRTRGRHPQKVFCISLCFFPFFPWVSLWALIIKYASAFGAAGAGVLLLPLFSKVWMQCFYPRTVFWEKTRRLRDIIGQYKYLVRDQDSTFSVSSVSSQHFLFQAGELIWRYKRQYRQ